MWGLVMKTRLMMAALLVPAMTVTAAGLVDAAPKQSAPKSLNWSQCYRDLSADTNQFLGELGEPPVRYECATVRVPLDHGDPNGAKTNLSLVRIPAADPAARIGSLFLNPGGPGGSGSRVRVVLRTVHRTRARRRCAGPIRRGRIRPAGDLAQQSDQVLRQ